MHTCAHVCTQANHRPHTPAHTRVHTCTRVHARPSSAKDARAHACTNAHACACTRLCAVRQNCMCVCTHARTPTNGNICMCTHVHTRAHMCMHVRQPFSRLPPRTVARPTHTCISTHMHIRAHVCVHTRARYCRCVHNKVKFNRDYTCGDTYGHTPIRTTHPPACVGTVHVCPDEVSYSCFLDASRLLGMSWEVQDTCICDGVTWVLFFYRRWGQPYNIFFLGRGMNLFLLLFFKRGAPHMLPALER